MKKNLGLWAIAAVVFLAVIVSAAKTDRLSERIFLALPVYVLAAHWVVAFLSGGEIYYGGGSLGASSSTPSRVCFFLAGIILIIAVITDVMGLDFLWWKRELAPRI